MIHACRLETNGDRERNIGKNIIKNTVTAVRLVGGKKNAATEDSSENNEATENEVNETEKMKKEGFTVLSLTQKIRVGAPV